ncbi:response regulator transcription factor [Inhella gelatinilytica]|uniref:Response regulator n=1 Tax=Inhella gelatinilytica TaxID=2795030 RepID=A0A931ISY0_9BURK|nr:response regulator [Inhella gelatinilytica]MBH9551559.1 response regulator [Inhella gelatinilytica]
MERAKLMVVDDDPISLGLYEAVLSDDFDLELLSSGVSCLERMAEVKPAAILLDVEMPELDGYETCRRLRAQDPEGPPVLFVSARDQLQDRMMGYDAGGTDYVCKPWQGPELVIKVQRLLAAEEQRKALARERDEAMDAVLGSADMAGELGVVLDFQRGLNDCTDYQALAKSLLDAVERYGLDGCVRVSGRSGAVSMNRAGLCTSLEWSILESLAAKPGGARIQAMGPNTAFNFGALILFVRALAGQGGDTGRMERAVDNVALLLESAVARLAAIDSGRAAMDLEHLRHIVSMTKSALAEVAQRNRAMVDTVRKTFEGLQSDLDDSFLHLGLMQRQEDFLSELVRAQSERVLQALAEGQKTERVLQRIVAELSAGL